MLAVPLLAVLALAPPAAAKGPHAILTTAPEGIAAGRPWESTVQLNELPGRPRPSLVATRRDGHVDASLRRVPARMRGARRFKATMVFPVEGRWRLLLIAGGQRFRFPAVEVGGGSVPRDYVAFAAGSQADEANAGGVYMGPEPLEGGASGALPPEVFEPAGDREPPPGDEVSLWWLLPAVGVVLAGAGLATLRGRR